MKYSYDTYNYPNYWQGREYEDLAEKIVLEDFLEKIPQKGSIVDIGGGFGRHAQTYCGKFDQCILIDPSKKELDFAKDYLKDIKNIDFKIGSGEKLPLKDKSTDVAMLIRVIHHVEKPLEVFKEVNRILTPKGYFILEFANKIHFRATLKAYLKGNFDFNKDLEPVNQATKEDSITFLNHHPYLIKRDLDNAGFKVLECRSVSNFRLPLIKKIVPTKVLLFLEAISHKLLANSHFGPSIFLLCQKV